MQRSMFSVPHLILGSLLSLVLSNTAFAQVPISDIKLLKEVSLDGGDFSDAGVGFVGTTDATYRFTVTNTGDTSLILVNIHDPALGLFFKPIKNLTSGEHVIIKHDTAGFENLFQPGICVDTDPVFNGATVSALGVSVFEPEVSDYSSANVTCEIGGPSPVCNVAVDKTCMVEPSMGDDLLCTSKIASTTLRYTGPDMENAHVTFVGKNGGYAEYFGVKLVSGETVLTSQNGYTIDSSALGSRTTIIINGVEEIIHTSCSAVYRAGHPAPLDANTPNPSNSSKGDPSPNWFVVNFRQDDEVIIEEPSNTGGSGADACTVPFGGANVHFDYKITNTGTTSMDLTSVLDSIAGEQLLAPEVLAPGDELSLSADPMFVDQHTEMSVNAKANVTGDPLATCEDSDTVVISVEPAPQLTCKELKPVTALSMVWDGPSGVDILTKGGQLFKNVQTGNKITFNAAGMGNDVELTLSGAVNGSSKFHVSCSDQGMNGPEDCGSNQGNGKRDDSGWSNDWLLDAMTGADGELSCSLPNTGVVEPVDGGPVGGALRAELKDIKGKEYKINIINDGSADATIVSMTIVWPDENGYLHEIKRGKDKIYHSHSSSSPLTIIEWGKGSKKKGSKNLKIKSGQKKEFKLKFKKNADKNASNYLIEIEFDDGTVITVQ